LYPESSPEFKEGRIQQLEPSSWLLEQQRKDKPVVDSMGLYPKDSPEYIASLQLEREYNGVGVKESNDSHRPIYDPLRLYTDSTQERIEGRIQAMEPREQTMYNIKNVVDPLGLYPRNSAEYETSMKYEKEMSMDKKNQRELYDPLGLYTASSMERQAGAVKAVEPPFEAIKPVLDPMNLYKPEQRDEIRGGVATHTDVRIMSEALPFLQRPAVLDGSLAGDVGFDPFGFSKTPTDLAFYRQAELKHARIAMLAAAGWPLSELWDKQLAAFLHMKPLLVDGDRVPSLLNGGLSHVNPFYWMGVLALTGLAEGIQMMTTRPLSSNNVAGWAVTFDESNGGPAFDPLRLFPQDAYGQRRMELAEIKNGRLAMLAITAFAVMEAVSKTAVVESTPFFFHPPF
jgi:Chlorophyll A-B binding protein